jgi:hypothetical protein
MTTRKIPVSLDRAAQVWQSRTDLVKQEQDKERAENDAKTLRLRALRLDKEAADAEAARNAPPAPVAAKKRAKRAG